jgi:hypothetical protein
VISSTCVLCGATVPVGQSRCGRHRTGRAARRRRGGGAGIERFRAAVLKAAAYRCEAVVEGRRCEVTGAANLEAHHEVGVAAGGANAAENGRALCHAHQLAIEGRRARSGR